ncbi:MAG: prolyl oligopeptidase family serine peptidase [Pirellulaceae bacterium]
MLTQANGTHEVTFSPNGQWLIDRWSRVDSPPVHELRRVETGERVVELETADVSRLLATGWRMPERFVAAGRDGTTPIHGVIMRPTHFDPAQQWPVIEVIYAGPQGAFVPKAFSPFHYGQEMAELGFVIVRMDGMGTNWRSKAFHDVCWRNLGDSGFPDRIAWMRAAQRQYDYLNLDRVGIYGGSAGGQSALRALLAHGDFYKVAAADCGCHDNRMDKIWWNELWMGWPIGPHYEEQSNVTQAHRLEGDLLLSVGELDRNVDPASTLQVVDALIKADKDFELLFIPGGGHGAGESPYGQRRRREFFVEKILRHE